MIAVPASFLNVTRERHFLLPGGHTHYLWISGHLISFLRLSKLGHRWVIILSTSLVWEAIDGGIQKWFFLNFMFFLCGSKMISLPSGETCALNYFYSHKGRSVKGYLHLIALLSLILFRIISILEMLRNGKREREQIYGVNYNSWTLLSKQYNLPLVLKLLHSFLDPLPHIRNLFPINSKFLPPLSLEW